MTRKNPDLSRAHQTPHWIAISVVWRPLQRELEARCRSRAGTLSGISGALGSASESMQHKQQQAKQTLAIHRQESMKLRQSSCSPSFSLIFPNRKRTANCLCKVFVSCNGGNLQGVQSLLKEPAGAPYAGGRGRWGWSERRNQWGCFLWLQMFEYKRIAPAKADRKSDITIIVVAVGLKWIISASFLQTT